MMPFNGVKVGFGITGSFCTIGNIIPVIKDLVSQGATVFPILSDSVRQFDTRFGKAKDLADNLREITGNNIITSIVEAEPIGPKSFIDILVIAPCTGNTLAKIANGITDTPVTMACKANLRNNKPVVLSIATNDGLGANAKNIGVLLNTKNIYMVPFGQDNPYEKCNSLVAKAELIIPTMEAALQGKQIQPLLV